MPNTLSKGSNIAIMPDAGDIKIKLNWSAPDGYNLHVSAFMLNDKSAAQQSDSRVFSGQPVSKDNSVHLDGDARLFNVKLNSVSPGVTKIAFTVILDDTSERKQKFSDLAFLSISVIAASNDELTVFTLCGADMENGTAMIVANLYLHNGQWKFKAVGQGFYGGLSTLCNHFGVLLAEASTLSKPVEADLNHKRVSLEKKIAETPVILSLAKKALVSLEKVLLKNHKARLALCLDISISMDSRYRSGKMQELINRSLALGCQLDDDGQIDVFLFGENACYAGEVGLGNFSNFTKDTLRVHRLESDTDYGKAIKLIREFYFPSNNTEPNTVVSSDMPVYVMFPTDGDTSREYFAEQQIKEASFEPIFWQFMSIGNQPFRFLKKLDSLPNRYIDNAGFFSVSDPAQVSEEKMYDLLMSEYPKWVQKAKAKGILKTR